MASNSSLILKLVQDVTQKGSIEQAIQRAQSLYSLKPYRISQITSSQAIKLYQSIYIKFYKGHTQTIINNWYQNQLRIFIWTLICYIYVKQCKIQDLIQQDWNFFSKIFDRKDPKLFQYQSQAIYTVVKGKIWQQQQQQLLKQILMYKIIQNRNKVNKAKWNEISKQLFQQSQKKYFRTAKQCRQKWYNHLDPLKIKGYWKAKQCLIMFEFVQQHGKKWANLVKILNDTRNQHSVKNKFNSIIKKHKKLHKVQNQQEMYQAIINRIKKSVQSRQLFESADTSFQLQQHNSLINASRQQLPFLQCHQVTKNFIKLLQNFNTDNCTATDFSQSPKQYENCHQDLRIKGFFDQSLYYKTDQECFSI